MKENLSVKINEVSPGDLLTCDEDLITGSLTVLKKGTPAMFLKRRFIMGTIRAVIDVLPCYRPEIISKNSMMLVIGNTRSELITNGSDAVMLVCNSKIVIADEIALNLRKVNDD